MQGSGFRSSWRARCRRCGAGSKGARCIRRSGARRSSSRRSGVRRSASGWCVRYDRPMSSPTSALICPNDQPNKIQSAELGTGSHTGESRRTTDTTTRRQPPAAGNCVALRNFVSTAHGLGSPACLAWHQLIIPNSSNPSSDVAAPVHGFCLQSRPDLDAMVSRICRAWRRYSTARIFHYYRDLIRFRERGDPAVLLRAVNPREANMSDAAAGVHVR